MGQPWEPLLSSCIVSLLIGVSGMFILCTRTQQSRKLHAMNVFNHYRFALLFSAFFVRSLLWVVWVYPGEQTPIPSDTDDPSNPP